MADASRTPPRGTAKDRALRLLGVRWRSREELRRRLRQAGFEAEEISDALDDLERAGLVEDERFARELARDQATRRLAGNRVIRNALREKGVAPEIVDAVLEESGAEADRALTLASRRGARMQGLDPDAAYRRLHSLLLRRGFSYAVAAEAARAALRASGWDADDGSAGGPQRVRPG